jgi:hypothetical protein
MCHAYRETEADVDRSVAARFTAPRFSARWAPQSPRLLQHRGRTAAQLE